MTGKVFLILVALVTSGAVASAQEPGGPGAGKLEVGGFPGGGLWFVGGDDNTEVDFNNYDFGGGATWYVSPVMAIEAEAAFGLGISQNVNYRNQEVHRIQMPHTLSTGGNLVVFPGGSTRRVAGYVTGGVGTLTLYSPYGIRPGLWADRAAELLHDERGRRREDFPARGRAELGLPNRLPGLDGEQQQRCGEVVRAEQAAHGTPVLHRNAVHVEALESCGLAGSSSPARSRFSS